MTPRLGFSLLFTLAVALFTTALVSGSVGTFAIGDWTVIEPALESRSGAAAAQLSDGTVLVTGGDTGSGATNSAEVYDVMSGTWTSADALLDARGGHTMTALKDGRVAIVGGASGSAVLSSIEVLDPSTGQRSVGPSLNTARREHGAAQLPDGRLFIVGGSDGSNALASTEIVDLESGEVTAGPDLPQPRTAATASTLLNGNVLIAGGNNGEQDLASTLIYNPATGSLTAGGSLTTPRSGHAATVLPHNHSVLMAGGKSGDSQLSSAELYVYWQNASKTTGSMSAPRSGAAAAGTGAEGVAIIAGGSDNSAEAYGFATVQTDKDDYAPGTTVYITGSGFEPGETVSLALDEAPLLHSRRTMTAVADASGNIANSDFAPEAHDVGVRFYLTATGGSSARSARNTFTDGNLSSSISFSIGPTSVAAGGSLSWNLTATCQNGGGVNTCASEGYVAGAAVQDGYSVDIQRSTTSTFTVATTTNVATASTTGGAASGSLTAPASGGPYFYRARHENQNLANVPVAGNATNSWQPQNSNAVQVTLIADSSAPVITPNITGTLGANGWYTSNVDVSWTVTDPESTVSSSTGCGPTSITTDTTGVTLTCSATSAGGTASQSVTIKRDATAPSITATPSPAANGAGWNNSDVSVSYNCTDTTSGVNAGASDLTSDLLTASGNATGSCVDNAGNSANASYDAQIDKAAPVITGTRLTAANGNGWNNTNVDVQFTCADEAGGSGIVSSPTSETVTVSTEGSNQTANSTLACADAAGNSAAAASVTGISIDKTAPSISAQRDTAPNSFGWNNTDVASSYTASDALSGLVEAASGTFTFTSEGADQSHTFTVHDLAGNSASATVSNVDIDKTAPTASATPTPSPNGSGWNNTDVTVSFSGNDALSGIDTCSADVSLTAETSGTPVSGTCTDKAGNISDSASVTVKIDKTAPTINANRTPGPNAFGWNNTDVLASYNAADSLSGLASPTTGSFTFSLEGAGQSHIFTVSDNAGNSASATISDVNIDKTAPALSPTVSPNPVVLNGSATAAPNATDALSGVQSSSCPAVSTSSVGGAQSVSCTAADFAGNSNTVAANYSVQYASGGLCLGSSGHQILEPINANGTSVFKQKSTVPAKFRVCDANGNSIGTAGVVSSFRLIQVVNGLFVSDINEPVEATNNDVAFRWSPTDLQWIFNMNTKGLVAGRTYVYQILLNDGTSIYFQFGLK